MDEVETDQAKQSRKRWWRNIALVLLVVTPIAAVAIAPWDVSIVQAVKTRDLPGDIEKGLQLSEAFAHGAGVFLIFSLLLTIDRANRRKILIVLGMVITAMVLANLSKGLFSRARPYAGHELEDITKTWFPDFAERFWDSRVRSFPSGHSATAAIMGFGLSMVYPRGRYLFAIIAILACLQRIASESHYPTDVLAGVSIAAAVNVVWQFIFPREIFDCEPTKIASNAGTAENAISDS